jgi:hypothetical protein
MKRLWLLLVLLAAGCTEPAPRVTHAGPFPGRIVLMPLNNHSNNMLGPLLVRKLLELHLAGSGYNPMGAKDVDTRLNSIGITDGGQLGAIPPAKVGEVMGADGILYGELLQFGYTNLGVYNKRIVEVRLFLVQASTGLTIWDSTRKGTTTKIGLDADAIKENFVVGLVEKYAETILRNPLRPEAETAVQALVKDLNRARNNW